MGGTSAQEPVQRPQDSSNPTQLQGQAAGCEKGGGGGARKLERLFRRGEGVPLVFSRSFLMGHVLLMKLDMQ